MTSVKNYYKCQNWLFSVWFTKCEKNLQKMPAFDVYQVFVFQVSLTVWHILMSKNFDIWGQMIKTMSKTTI